MHPAKITAFNIGIQLVWGAVLAISLQARTIELAGTDAIKAYALLAAAGAGLAAAMQIVAGRLSDVRAAQAGHRREWYLFGAIAAVPFLLWLYVATTFEQLTIAFFGLQIAMNAASGPYQAAIPDHTPPEQQGRTAAWMSAFQSIGAAAGLITAGFVHAEATVGVLLAIGLSASFTISYLHLRKLPFTAPGRETTVYPRALLALLISRGCINTGFYMLLGFLIFFVRDSLHVGDAAAQRTDAALLFLTFTLAGIAGAIVAGRPADRQDKRLVATIANAVMIAALVVLARAEIFAIAYAAAAIAGVAWGAFITVDWAIACAMLPRGAIATAMGIWNLASIVPQIAAPLIAAPIVLYGNTVTHGTGPRYVMLAAACAYLAGTIVLWRLPVLRTAAVQ